MRTLVSRTTRVGPPLALLAIATNPTVSRRWRRTALGALVALWTLAHARYRHRSRTSTAWEKEVLRAADWEAYSRHYNENMPTIEEEYDLCGPYHRHRHEMRYGLVGRAVSAHFGPGDRVLDVGCGSAFVADRIAQTPATYVGVDFGGHHITDAQRRYAKRSQPLGVAFALNTAEALPFSTGSFDVVVMSGVIEHLLRPEIAVWEVARVLRPGGVFVMTTNNASEVPLLTPLSHPFAWIEKIAGAYCPQLISRRPWISPDPVHAPAETFGADKISLPRTHHIFAETRRMFAAAGLEVVQFQTFEFPPPQSATARCLETHGERGRKAVDLLEVAARAIPGINKLGTHLFLLSCKTTDPITVDPPAGIWPGPFSP